MAGWPPISARDAAWFLAFCSALAFAASVYQFLEGFLPAGVPGILLCLVIAAVCAALVLGGIMVVTRLLASGPKPPWFVALVGAVLLLVGAGSGYGLSRVWDLEPRLDFAINGVCEHVGQTLHASSAHFTPGGQYVSQVWYPDGTVYDLDSDQGTAREDGSVGFRWTCEAVDPDGVYQAEITDLETGRHTDRVRFVVRAGGPVPTGTPTPTPTPSASASPSLPPVPSRTPSPTRTTTSPSLSPVEFSVIGECGAVGETLLARSAGFTPGGNYRSEAWYPNGSRYPLDATIGVANRDGTVKWRWACEAEDPPGTYVTEVTDLTTGRKTGRVSFEVR